MSKEDSHFRIAREFLDVESRHSGLCLTLHQNGSASIRGTLDFSCDYDEKNIQDAFKVDMHISADYPAELPVVWESGGRIPKDFHKLDDASLCLETRLHIRRRFRVRPSLIGYIENLVIPYLFSYSYFEKYNVMPYGERGHGPQGVLESYQEIFGVEDEFGALALLKILAEDSYRGHEFCPCGSGAKLRDCDHGPQLRIMKHDMSLAEYMMDYNYILLYFVKAKRGGVPPKVLTKKLKNQLYGRYKRRRAMKKL